jgi:hypothetical protein
MPTGYSEEPYFEPDPYPRRKRISQGGQRSQPMHKASSRAYPDRQDYRDEYYNDYNYYPPPRRDYRAPARSPKRFPPPPPPRRKPTRYYQDEYYDRQDHRPPKDYGYDYGTEYGEDYPRREHPSRSSKAPKKTEASSSSGASKAVLAIAIIIVILFVLYMFRGPIMEWLQNPTAPALRYQEYPDGVDFTVDKIMDLKVSGTRQDSISYTLKSACPKDYLIGDFYLQDVKDVDLTPIPDTGIPDFNDRTQEIMVWQEDNFLGTTTFTATYTIRTRFFEWELDKTNTGVISDIPQTVKDRYNHDEWKIDYNHDDNLDNYDSYPDKDEDIDNDGEWDYFIEPSNQQIKSKAMDLKDGETNVYKVVKNIYNYLTSDKVLRYVPSSSGLPKNCIQTLKDKKGDCDDYSILFISLCRAVGIPAWLELGVLYDRAQSRWGGHAWAKVALPFEDTWTAASIDIVNHQFLFYDPFRFIEWIDTGGDLTVTEDGVTKNYNNLDYYYHSFSYRSYGRPSITSPDTNYFETVELSEFGETHKIPVEGEGGSDVCMIPSFEALNMLMAVTIIIFIVAILGTKRKDTQ